MVKDTWDVAQPVYMCFMEQEKTFKLALHDNLWGVHRDYRVRGFLLGTIWSLNKLTSLVHIAAIKSDVFPMNDKLHQGCHLSWLLFLSFMDRI